MAVPHRHSDAAPATRNAQAATENLGMIYSGGKKDDITVLVCLTE